MTVNSGGITQTRIEELRAELKQSKAVSVKFYEKWLAAFRANRKALRYEEKLVKEIRELENKLRTIRCAILPDPNDERDISLEWLKNIIWEQTE